MDAAAKTQLDPLLEKYAIGVTAKLGCTIKGIAIDATNFDKTADPMQPVLGLHGVLLKDLPAGSVTHLEDIVITDTFNGVFAYDDGAASGQRTVVIRDCDVFDCGPTPLGFQQGHAGIRLLEADEAHIDLYVLDCHFENNHDALEPGLATLYLQDSSFVRNENGLEYADTIGGPAIVDGCVFQLNQRFDWPTENAFTPTGAIVARYNGNGFDLTVRATEFDQNQIGVSLKGGGTGNIDFGTSLSTGPPYLTVELVLPYTTIWLPTEGGNTFTTDITSPWHPGIEPDYTVSYCGLLSVLDTDVFAVGNTWKYDASGDPAVTGGADHNQGVGTNGTIPTGSSFEISPGENFDENPPLTPDPPGNQGPLAQIPNPFHRAWAGYGSQDQQDWNFSTGPEIGTTGRPRIILVP